MTFNTRTLLATVATAMLALGATAPASAQAGPGRDHIDWQARDQNRDHGRDQGRNDGRRFAVEQCSRAATEGASRLGNARVTGIDGVDMTRDGAQVRGELAVTGRSWHGNSYQRGSFTCRIDHGRIAGINYRGLRGLRGQ